MELTVDFLKNILDLAFGGKVVLNEGGTIFTGESEENYLDYYVEVVPSPADSEHWHFLRARRWDKLEIEHAKLDGNIEQLLEKDKENILKSIVTDLIANIQPLGLPSELLESGSFSELIKDEWSLHYPSRVEQKVIRQYEMGLIKRVL